MRSAIAVLVASGVLFAADQGRPSPPLTILRQGGPPIALKDYQGNVPPPDAVYEPTSRNGFPTWESLVTWVSRR